MTLASFSAQCSEKEPLLYPEAAFNLSFESQRLAIAVAYGGESNKIQSLRSFRWMTQAAAPGAPCSIYVMFYLHHQAISIFILT
jgi:hypothetical protein